MEDGFYGPKETAGAGFERSEAVTPSCSEGPCCLVLPLELVAPTEDSGAFDEENYGYKPKVSVFQQHGEPAEENYRSPDERQRSKAACNFFQDLQGEGRRGSASFPAPEMRLPCSRFDLMRRSRLILSQDPSMSEVRKRPSPSSRPECRCFHLDPPRSPAGRLDRLPWIVVY